MKRIIRNDGSLADCTVYSPLELFGSFVSFRGCQQPA